MLASVALAALVGVPVEARVASTEPGAEQPEVELDTKTEVSPRIVGGATAPAGAWPSQVGLLHSGTADDFSAQFCGGTVIARSWVLTAAHCVTDLGSGALRPARSLDVLVGAQSLTSGGTRIRAAEVRVISGFDRRSLHRDVAVIRLSRPTVMPPQKLIAQGSTVPGDTSVVATGWGSQDDSGGPYPTRLQQVTLQTRTDAQCSQAYGGAFIASSMTCAGVPDGGKDTCFGDSGGPLVRKVGSQWVQMGITSWGAPGSCGQGRYPGVYTRVSAFSNWINRQIRYGPHRDATAFVRRMHLDLFDRQPTDVELWVGAVRLNDGLAPHTYASELIRGDLYQSRMGMVIRLYRAYFQRDPDAARLAHWWDRVNNGAQPAAISGFFARSSEFTAAYGGLTNRQFVQKVYRTVLGRAGEPAGVDYWTAELDSSRRTRAGVMLGFSESPENRARQQAGVDTIATTWALLRRPPTSAELAEWSALSNEALVRRLLASHTYHRRGF
ncbi:hypothetical protein BH20ACT3_BH20ACT3_05280 [soil metagenome]